MQRGIFTPQNTVFDRYDVLGFISSGTYGRVYKARYRDGRPGEFAIKKFKNTAEPDTTYTGLTQSAIREMSLCSELSHVNVIRAVEVLLEDRAVYIVFEYAEHDLLRIIHHHGQGVFRESIPARMIKSIMFQLLAGVLHLHRNWVLHRDLKPANIMVGRDGSVKVGDLGLARIFRRPLATLYSGDKVVVTIWYRAPELLLGARHYTPAIDIWSVGCIFAELLSLRPIFKGDEAVADAGKKTVPFQRNQISRILEVTGAPTAADWPLLEHMPDAVPFNNLVRTLSAPASPVGDIRHASLERWFHSVVGARYKLPERLSGQASEADGEADDGDGNEGDDDDDDNNGDNYNDDDDLEQDEEPVDPDGALDRHALSFLEGLLTFDPDKRLTAQQALMHPYFTADAEFESLPALQRNCFAALPARIVYPARRVSADKLDGPMAMAKSAGMRTRADGARDSGAAVSNSAATAVRLSRAGAKAGTAGGQLNGTTKRKPATATAAAAPATTANSAASILDFAYQQAKKRREGL